MTTYFSPICDVLRRPDGIACGLLLRASHYKAHTSSLWPYALAFGCADLSQARLDPDRGFLSTGNFRREHLPITPTVDVDGSEVDEDDEVSRQLLYAEPTRERILLLEHPGGGPGVLWGRLEHWSIAPLGTLLNRLEGLVDSWVHAARTYYEYADDVPSDAQPSSPLPSDVTPMWWEDDAWESESPARWWLRPGVRSTIAAWYESSFYIYSCDPEIETLIRGLHRALNDDSLALGLLSAPASSVFDRSGAPCLVTRGGLLFADMRVAPNDLRTLFPSLFGAPARVTAEHAKASVKEAGAFGAPGPALWVTHSGFAALERALAETGVAAQLRAADRPVESLTPTWTFYPTRYREASTAYPIRVDLDSLDETVQTGLCTIEELQAWTRGEGRLMQPRVDLFESLRAQRGAPAAVTEANSVAEADEAEVRWEETLATRAREADAEVQRTGPAHNRPSPTLGGGYSARVEMHYGLSKAQLDIAEEKLDRILRDAPPLPGIALLANARVRAVSSPRRVGLLAAPEGVGLERRSTYLDDDDAAGAFMTKALIMDCTHPHERRWELAGCFGNDARWPSCTTVDDPPELRAADVARLTAVIRAHPADTILFQHAEILGEDGTRELLDACKVGLGDRRHDGPTILLWYRKRDGVAPPPYLAVLAEEYGVPCDSLADWSLDAFASYLTNVHPAFAACAELLGRDLWKATLQTAIGVGTPLSISAALECVAAYTSAFWRRHGVSADLAADLDALGDGVRAQRQLLFKQRALGRWARADHRPDAFKPGGGRFFGAHPSVLVSEFYDGLFADDPPDDTFDNVDDPESDDWRGDAGTDADDEER